MKEALRGITASPLALLVSAVVVYAILQALIAVLLQIVFNVLLTLAVVIGGLVFTNPHVCSFPLWWEQYLKRRRGAAADHRPAGGSATAAGRRPAAGSAAAATGSAAAAAAGTGRAASHIPARRCSSGVWGALKSLLGGPPGAANADLEGWAFWDAGFCTIARRRDDAGKDVTCAVGIARCWVDLTERPEALSAINRAARWWSDVSSAQPPLLGESAAACSVWKAVPAAELARLATAAAASSGSGCGGGVGNGSGDGSGGRGADAEAEAEASLLPWVAAALPSLLSAAAANNVSQWFTRGGHHSSSGGGDGGGGGGGGGSSSSRDEGDGGVEGAGTAWSVEAPFVRLNPLHGASRDRAVAAVRTTAQKMVEAGNFGSAASTTERAAAALKRNLLAVASPQAATAATAAQSGRRAAAAAVPAALPVATARPVGEAVVALGAWGEDVHQPAAFTVPAAAAAAAAAVECTAESTGAAAAAAARRAAAATAAWQCVADLFANAGHLHRAAGNPVSALRCASEAGEVLAGPAGSCRAAVVVFAEAAAEWGAMDAGAIPVSLSAPRAAEAALAAVVAALAAGDAVEARRLVARHSCGDAGAGGGGGCYSDGGGSAGSGGAAKEELRFAEALVRACEDMDVPAIAAAAAAFGRRARRPLPSWQLAAVQELQRRAVEGTLT